MKTVFLTNSSFSAKFLANRLSERGLLDAIIIEETSTKIFAKILREFNSTSWIKFPEKILDILAIWVYSKLVNRYIETRLLKPSNIKSFPEAINFYKVKSVSDSQCLSILNSLEPELIIVFGTSILKGKILSIAKYFTLNIHGGIVPKYRNVHSDFWAISKNDLKNIGTSIIHLDPGIDTGDVAIQEIVDIDSMDSIFSIKRKNIELSLRLITQAIEMANSENLPKIPQKKIINSFYKTPGYLDFLKLIWSNHKILNYFS
tara:strand:+ start:724 stop:1503 length:780 start_codon:yes stop_codon:yes gene_type:complete